MKKTSLVVGLMMSTVLVSGCQTFGGAGIPGFSSASSADNSFILGAAQQPSGIKALVRQSREALAENRLEDASRYVNLALKLDVTSSDLQFMNGLVYHLMGKAGDSSKYPLAEQGYRQALRFDPGNLSAQYQLGLLYMDQRRYGLAQGHIAAVAVHRGDDPAVLYSLASASYYARDPRTAEGALKRLMEVAPEAAKKPEVLKARALALAAMGDRAAASRYAETYRTLSSDGRQARQLDRRLDGWRSFYESDVRMLPTQYGGTGQTDPYGSYQASPSNPYGSSQSPYGASSNPYEQPGAAAGVGTASQGQGFAGNDMVVVDVVLIGTQEDIRDSRGINLLNGLQLQFGNPLTGTAGLSYSRNNINDKIDSGLDENTTTITSLINIPAVTYSLNIANALNARNQVLAKPSLVAQAGQTSEFFSGTEILAAAVSGGNGDSVSVQKEVGVKLAVTPEILPDDMIRLHVVAERTFLTDPSNSVVFEFRLDTTKTNVNSTVTMKFGETLILGGLSERETSNSSDGVPGLMDIPGLNYLFSERSKREFERSILILLTPRRPHYTRQAASDRNGVEEKMSELEKDLSRLHKRHKDWFTPRPTFDGIVDSLKGQEFFEEFRAGDIEIQSWRNDPAGQGHIALVQKRLLVN